MDNNIFAWMKYELRNKQRVREKKKLQQKSEYGQSQLNAIGEHILSAEEVNKVIADKILQGVPFWAGRMGYIEMDMIRQVLQHRIMPFLDHRQEILPQLCNNAGFFPNDMSEAEKFVDLLLNEMPLIDMQGYWNLYMEDYLHHKLQKAMLYPTYLNNLEPWQVRYEENGIKPWTASLKGKRVLVVHPFEDSIRRQYDENRKFIFSSHWNAEDILPEFELLTLKAVQTMTGMQDERFATWFDALAWMKEECHKKSFDVAIIGCGAYGYPLAAEIKRMGKVAIHLGGATQILFGIIGRRWETEYGDFFKDVVNEYWIRPSATERIARADTVEQACYW